ncbi:MAG: serine/threonine-protein kinase [Kofleriaceae bacterium]
MSERWGDFLLEQLIAVGGLGEVWRATKNGTSGALKRMHTHLTRNDEALAMFAQEQRLVIDLPRHPNVVRGIEAASVPHAWASSDTSSASEPSPSASLRDASESSPSASTTLRDASEASPSASTSLRDASEPSPSASATLRDVGLPYVFLELAPGLDLRRIVAPPATRERPTTGAVSISRDRALWIVAAACDAVAHLHANGWVHGDVNPSNLIVSPAVPGSGPPAATLKGVNAPHSVKLVDLGIARRLGEAGPTRGTHAYMAPEQVRAQPWTAATDVFALGIVLWELTAGTRLFHRGPTWLSMAAVVEADVPALPDKEIDAICRAALVKDPGRRLASAAMLADQLRSLSSN